MNVKIYCKTDNNALMSWEVTDVEGNSPGDVFQLVRGHLKENMIPYQEPLLILIKERTNG